MLHLARKAFFPAPPPFPLLHVDTTWKFQQMYEFRDKVAADLGVELLVHQNPRPRAGHQPVQPRVGGAHRHVEDPRAQAGAGQGFDSVLGAHAATRRSPGPRSGSSSARRSTAGIPSSSAPSSGAPTTCGATPARPCGSSRSRTGPSWTCGSTSTEDILIVPLYFGASAGRRTRRRADHGGRRPLPALRRRGAAAAQRALPDPRLLSAQRRRGEHRRHPARRDPGDAADHHLGAPGPGHRPRLRRVGEEEAGRLLR